MYPMPVMAGESVTLRCLIWGTNQISETVFYKNNSVVQENKGPTLEIPNVKESAKARYKCLATFTYPARTAGPAYNLDSDLQDLYIYGMRVKHQFQCLWLQSSLVDIFKNLSALTSFFRDSNEGRTLWRQQLWSVMFMSTVSQGGPLSLVQEGWWRWSFIDTEWVHPDICQSAGQWHILMQSCVGGGKVSSQRKLQM